jgi:hypothetical protein
LAISWNSLRTRPLARTTFPTGDSDTEVNVTASRGVFCKTAVLLFLLGVPLPVPGAERPRAANGASVGANQFAVDGGGPLTWSLSYVHRLGVGPFSVGGGAGFGWELNVNNLDRNVWNAGYLDGIVRYQPARFLQLEAGPTWLHYNYADDCGACAGTFVGMRVGAGVGYKYIYAGVDVRLGLADDDRHGSKFGAIWTPRLRLAVSWGR